MFTIDISRILRPIQVQIINPVVVETPAPKIHIQWQIGPVKLKSIKGKTMDLILLDNQKTTATIKPTDDRGGPASIDGVPKWESSDDSVVKVTPDPSGLSAVLEATGTETAPGTQVTVTVTADADLSGETQEISDVINVTVNGSSAVSLGITTTPPEHV